MNCVKLMFLASAIALVSCTALGQAPVCDVTCTPNMSSPSYAGAAAARAKLLNARGSRNPLAATTLPFKVPKIATVIGSQSYNYAIPVLSISGRAGLDLNLNLYYNSRVWDVDTGGNTATFNADRDFPSYGFRLDFGYVEKVGTGANVSYIVTENDGSKHQMLFGSTTYDSTDGTYLSYDPQANALYYKNGTIIYYEGFPSQGSTPTLFRPTQIRDTNGNCIFFAYLAGHDQFLQYIVDTGNRTIVFNYTQSGSLFLLHDISEAISGGVRTYATFQWGTLYGTGSAWYNFTPSLAVKGAPSLTTPLNVITSCTYANNTGYSFTYGDWGVVNKISNFSAANTNPPTVRSHVSYNFPAANAGALTDAPSYTQQTVSPDGTSANASNWTYSVSKSGTGVVTSMTVTDPLAANSDPSGSITTSTLNQNTGLLTSVQINNGTNTATLRTIGYTWTTSGQATVPSQITTINDAGQVSYVQYAYDPSGFGNVSDVYEYDFGSVLKRHTVTTYQTAFQPYIARHILNLVTQVLVKDGSGNTIARTDMAYDGGSLTNVTGLSSHDDAGHGISYTARGNLTSVTRYANAAAGPPGITRTFTYNTLGNMLSAQLDCCNSKTFTYSIGTQYNFPDSAVRGPSGGPQFTSSFTYDNNLGLLLKSTDENGQQTQYQYDSMNRTTAVLLPPQSGTVVQLNTAYDDNAASPTVNSYTTNAGNTAQTLTTLDGLGHVLQVDNKDGSTVIGTTKSVYDKLWRRTQVSNPYAPNETPVYTTFAYDGLGRTIRVTPPSAGYTQYAYSGNTVIATDPAGKTRKSFSDALGRLIEVDEPGWGDAIKGSGSVIISGSEQSYCPLDSCFPSQYVYDTGNVKITVNGSTKTALYGQNSSPSSIASDLANQISNDGTFPVTAALSGTTITLTARQAGSNTNYSLSVSSATDDVPDFGGPSFTAGPSGPTLSGGVDGTPEGSPTLARPIVTTYAYDVLDNLTSASVAAMGPVNGVTYTGQLRTYVYDSLSRLTSVTTPESGTVTNFYTDISGQACANDPTLICRVQDARGIVKTLTYDGINRPLTVTYSDGTPSVTYTYDYGGIGAFALDRLTSITEGSNSQTFTYDNLGRITTANQTIDSVTYPLQYGYNLIGQVATITYPSGRVVTQAYNNIGQTASIASGTTTYISGTSYNAAGETLGLSMGNGVQGTFTYNDHLQIAKLRYFKTGSPDILNLGYDYTSTAQPNNNGQIQAVHYYTQDQPPLEDLTKSESFGYDAWNRLKTAQTMTVDANTQYTWSLTWGYDRLGNRKQQTLINGNMPNGVNQPNFSIDETKNQIIGYCYDGAGNLLDQGTCPVGSHQYVYDGANRLVSVSSSTAAYAYFGPLRIKKTLSGTVTRYIYAGSKPIAEYANGTLSKEYIYAGSTLIATIAGTNTTYHHPDHLSNRAETDANGAPARSAGNLPYGDPWYELTSTDPMKFTSYTRDSESGLDYAMFRNYNSGQGRFVSADVMHGHSSVPQSLNRYGYAMNDPVNLIDPNGLETVCGTPYVTTEWSDGHSDTLYGTAVCVYWDPFFTGVVGSPLSPLGQGAGGAGPAISKAIKALITNPDCAAIFGGLGQALGALFDTNYYDYQPGMQPPDTLRDPSYGFVAVFTFGQIGNDIAQGAYASTAYTPAPNAPKGNTFIGPRFYGLQAGLGASGSHDPGQETVILHEAFHVVTQSRAVDLSNDSLYGNYTDINTKCAPKSPNIPTIDNGPQPTFLTP
jgi:RHS repeat-associated protein